MLLIVGLGNPGEKYKNNRHNAGYMFIDHMVKWLNCYMAKKTKSYLTMQPSNHATILLAKPLTFMNNSGTAVKSLTTYHHLLTTNLIVVHDDLDIPLGKFKIQMGSGPRLHNGLDSIEKTLRKKNFWRVRIGIDNRPLTAWVDGESYVLQNFTKEEKEIIHNLFPVILNRLKNEFISESLK